MQQADLKERHQPRTIAFKKLITPGCYTCECNDTCWLWAILRFRFGAGLPRELCKEILTMQGANPTGKWVFQLCENLASSQKPIGYRFLQSIEKRRLVPVKEVYSELEAFWNNTKKECFGPTGTWITDRQQCSKRLRKAAQFAPHIDSIALKQIEKQGVPLHMVRKWNSDRNDILFGESTNFN